MFMIRLVVALEPETFMQLNDGWSKLMYSYPATGINIILAGTLYGVYPYLFSWHRVVSFCSVLLSLTTRLLYSNPTFNFPRLSARADVAGNIVWRWWRAGSTAATRELRRRGLA